MIHHFWPNVTIEIMKDITQLAQTFMTLALIFLSSRERQRQRERERERKRERERERE